MLSSLAMSALLLLCFMPLERLWPARGAGRREWTVDLLFASLGQPSAHALLAAPGAMLLAWVARNAAIVQRQPEAVATASGVCVGMLLFELAGYAYHRLAHRVPWLWRLHRVHHSAETLDALASFRQHPLEIVLLTLCQNLPLVLLGIPISEHVLIVVLLRVHAVFVHSDLAFPGGAWSAFIAGPTFHHRHHDRDAPDANFAALLPVLDRVFGTFDAGVGVRFGVRGAPTPRGFLALMFAPLRPLDRVPAPDHPGHMRRLTELI